MKRIINKENIFAGAAAKKPKPPPAMFSQQKMLDTAIAGSLLGTGIDGMMNLYAQSVYYNNQHAPDRLNPYTGGANSYARIGAYKGRSNMGFGGVY